MEAFSKYLKTGFFALLLTFFVAGNFACKPHKCVANGGELPKKVNKYHNKPQSGLWGNEKKRKGR